MDRAAEFLRFLRADVGTEPGVVCARWRRSTRKFMARCTPLRLAEDNVVNALCPALARRLPLANRGPRRRLPTTLVEAR